MNTFTLTKGDWSLTNFVLVIVALVAAVPFVGQVVNWIAGSPLEIRTGAVVPPPMVDDPQLQPGASGVYTGEAIFTIENATNGQWFYSLVVPAITLVVAAVCLWQVVQLVRYARADDPFHPRAHLAVRLIGLLLFCYGLFAPLLQVLMTAMITTQMRGGELNMALEFDAGAGWPIVVGLVVGAVGEAVFGRGRSLAEDAEGLV